MILYRIDISNFSSPYSILAQSRAEFIQQINTSSGIYFDPIGDLKIHASQLDVVIPYDMSYMEPHLKNINSILGTTRFICTQIELELLNNSNSLECHNMLEPLSVRYQDIVSGYSAISHLIDKRFKRAWIGGIGTLSKIVFGTLDENDAIRYDNAIKDLQNNDKRLGSLLKENILITSNILSKFNETVYKIQINEASLNLAIDNLTFKQKLLQTDFDKLTITSHINSILNSLEASILTLSFQLEDITNAIMLCSQNILHPAVLAPEQLYNEIVDNYRYLPIDLKLPINLALSNIHSLMNISRIACYSSDNKIVFILRIPLVTPKEYNVYHTIALPTPHNNVKPSSFSYVIPSHRYIAMTKDNSEYCNMDSLQECTIVNKREYICDVMTVFPTGANPSCESELLSKVISELPVQCHTDFLHGHIDLWKPLHNNAWIYVQSESNKLYVECPNHKISETSIIGTGILTLPNNCIAYCKSTKLITKSDNLNINVTVSHSDFNIINDSCCNLDKFKFTMSNEPSLTLQNIDLDTFTSETKSKLKAVSDETDKILNEHHIVKYETHYSILIMLIFCIILIFFIVKCFLYIKSHNRLTFQLPTFSQSNPGHSLPNQPPEPVPALPLKVMKRESEPRDVPSPSIRINV